MSTKPGKNAQHAKHLAFQIVAQLPESTPEALQVLDYARRLLLHPLDDEDPVVALKVVERGA